jgi:hypothetical protein
MPFRPTARHLTLGVAVTVLATFGGSAPSASQPGQDPAAAVQAAAATALEPGAARVEIAFRSPSTAWHAKGRAELGAWRYHVRATATHVRKPALRGNWELHGLENGVFWSLRAFGNERPHRCFIDGLLAGGSFGGALSTEKAIGMLEAYVRLLRDAIRRAERVEPGVYSVELDPVKLAEARYLERDAGGFGGRLSGRLIEPRAPIRVMLDREGTSLAGVRLRLRSSKPEPRHGIRPRLSRDPEPSRLRLRFLFGPDQGSIRPPRCAGVE